MWQTNCVMISIWCLHRIFTIQSLERRLPCRVHRSNAFVLTHYSLHYNYDLHSMWHGISVFHCPARLGISSECSQSDIQRLVAIRHDRSLLVQVNLSVNTMKCLVVLLRDCCFYDCAALLMEGENLKYYASGLVKKRFSSAIQIVTLERPCSL